MSAALSRLSGRKPVRWTTIVGLMLVPLTVAGVLLWGLWNPTERLDTVTAAIVNNDEAVEVDGQLVPLGRVLAGELIGDAKKKAADDQTNFTWVLTDEEDATAGLDDGRYATVITIPESFSASATSLSGDPDDAEQATIDIAESDRGRLIDTALSGIVTQTATTVLNQQLGEQFVGSVFVGMTELHKGIGEAADGATQLADGGEQLTDGANQLADGTQQLADGTQQLSSGAGELASGAGSLASGAGELAGGAGSLSSGANDLAGGAGTLAGGAAVVCLRGRDRSEPRDEWVCQRTDAVLRWRACTRNGRWDGDEPGPCRARERCRSLYERRERGPHRVAGRGRSRDRTPHPAEDRH